MSTLKVLAMVALAVVSLAGCGKARAPANPEPGWALRLPATVTPSRYDITVTPNAQAMTFKGSARISVDVQGETGKITLNANELTIDRAVLEDGSTAKVSMNAKAQTATLSFPRKIAPGRHDLLIDYRGKINTGSYGLFALDYADEDGTKQRMLVTHFSNADFRRFAPSWDEPARKAVFQISVIAPQAQAAVSNMPPASVQAMGGGLKKVTFQPTPKMSTYLAFLGVGDLERTTRNVDGVEIGIVTRRGAASRTGYALDEAGRFLRYFNQYFGVPYPLPKLDLIAAPGAGSFGAMENWGAILFFEPYLLVDPKLSAEADRQFVSLITAHEIAHMWFGDLVTMAWWDDLWLNESFASWMENKALQDLHPDWGQELVALDSKEKAIRLDATSATHPIVQPAETIDQVNQIGDAITYEKGSAVIAMIESYVGEDAFREGVRAYIKANAYGNARRDDLWRAVEAAARKPVVRMAKDFTEQAGAPLVRVDPVTGEDGAEAVLRQGRFGMDEASKQARFWRIPVKARSINGGPVIDQLLEAGPVVASISSPSAPPFVVNFGQTGYFRTLYAQPLFDALARRVGDLRAIDQMGMLYDAWALGAAGYSPVANVLELIQRLPARADARVWSGALGILTGIDDYYSAGPERDAYRAWATESLQPVFARVGWQGRRGESAATPILREQLIVGLSQFGDRSVIGEAQDRFQVFLTDPESLTGELRGAVLATVGQHADLGTFQALRRLAAETNDPEAKRQFLSAMAQAGEAAIAKRVLDLAFSAEVPGTLAPGVIRQVSVRHPELAFGFAVAHQKEINSRMDPAQQLSVVPNMLSQAKSAKAADDLRAFAQRAYPAGGRREADKVEARIRYRARVAAERLPEIDRWLQLVRSPQALERPAA